jgi:polysaccharide export outer membrane protein
MIKQQNHQGVNQSWKRWYVLPAVLVVAVLLLAACGTNQINTLNAQNATKSAANQSYLIGAGDVLNVFVWGNEDLSAEVTVRPDGKIATPLVEDVVASGKTPVQLARDMEQQLAQYIKNPVVTVMVQQFVGSYGQQIRIIGEAAEPRAIPYNEDITLLDVMIAVGGLTEFASGNDASIVRTVNGKQQQYRVRLDDLVKQGDISANVNMQPGDILIIPESWF